MLRGGGEQGKRYPDVGSTLAAAILLEGDRYWLPVPQDLLDAYRPDSLRLDTGLPDLNEQLLAPVAQHRLWAPQGVQRMAGALSAGIFNRAKFGTEELGQEAIIKTLARDGAYSDLVPLVREQRDAGLRRSPAANNIAYGLQIMYWPEMTAADRTMRELELTDIGSNDREILCTDGPASFTDAAAIIRAEKHVDLTRETLDARTKAYVDVATVEMAVLALSDLWELGVLLGKHHGKATRIFHEFAPTLFEDQGSTVMRLLERVADEFERLAHQTSNPKHAFARNHFIAEADRTRAVAIHASAVSYKLRDVYDGRGYPYPDHLLTDEEIREREHREAREGLTILSGVYGPETVDAEHEVPSTVDPATTAVAGIAEVLRGHEVTMLDEVILPTADNNVTNRQLQDQLGELAQRAAQAVPDSGSEEAATPKVIFERLQDLVEIATHYGGRLYRSAGLFGSRQPYFVAVIEREGRTFAVAESPMRGTASYIGGDDWRQVLTKIRTEARASGAHYIVHSPSAPHGEGHRQKIYNLLELLLRVER